MPKSKVRSKRPTALAGIPARVLALSPADWAPDKRASWCRHYLDGAAGRPLRAERNPRGPSPTWHRMAHRKGASDSTIAAADVAQTDQRLREKAASREAIERRRVRETGRRSEDMLSRIAMLGGGFDPHSDPRILGAALGALGIGLETLGTRSPDMSDD